jgi:hypothetical protein
MPPLPCGLKTRNGSAYPEVTQVNLPSSLMVVSSNAFVYYTRLPSKCLATVINILLYMFSRVFTLYVKIKVRLH